MHAARRSPLTIGVLAAELAVGAFVLAPPAAADDGPEPVVSEPAPPRANGTAEPPTDAPEPPNPRTGRAGEVPPASPDTPLPELPAPELPVPGTPAVLPPPGSPTVDAPLTALRTGRAADATPAAPNPTVDRDTTPGPDDAPRGRGKRKGAPTSPTASGDRTAPPATAPTPTPGAPPPTSAPAAAAPPAHVVATGESLWHIAGAHLAASTGRDRADVPLAEVAAYWVRVCDANQGTLRSGDLDLIYPGEVVQLPAL